MARIADVHVDPVTQIGATVGTKEFVAGTPHYLRMRRPDRDTVLYPEVSYPSYEQGAIFSGCRAVAVPVDDQWRIDLTAIDPDDAARALCLWVNTPGNPAGGIDDLAAAAAFGREHDVTVLSDECYIEFTWEARHSRSCSTAPTTCLRCTRSPSVQTSPVAEPASTPATPTSCSTCARFASMGA